MKVDNDGNAAALAEYRWGAGRGYRNVFYATIGTGIGAGIVFDGQIYHGRTGAAAEGGHVSIDYRGPRCACGKHGCIEVLAAGPAIARRARAKAAADPARGAALLRQANGNGEAITSELVGPRLLGRRSAWLTEITARDCPLSCSPNGWAISSICSSPTSSSLAAARLSR